MRIALLLPLVLGLLSLAALSGAEVYTWVDEEGITHIVDDPAAIPEAARGQAREGRRGLGSLWEEGVVGPVPGRPAPTPSGGGSLQEQRSRRLIRGAVADLGRGETARATVALESVLRADPNRAEAHWYLALLDRQRGRYDSAEAHLRAFLATAGDPYEGWRRSAQRKLTALADERRLADGARLEGTDAWVGISHPHFRVHYDVELGKASGDYATTVLRYLEEAHAAVRERLGVVPDEPLGVTFYGKAAYLRAHRHRFSFRTVGFFDGRIHVVSAAHPAGELRALLFHEYTHAVFREQTGGDRPFWLNEGMAELSERASRRQEGLTRSERAALQRRIDVERWIPLRRLAPSFAGLDDADARAAYLVATAAAAWIAGRTDRAQRGELLERLAAGLPDDEVFVEVLGLTTEEIDAAVREWVRDEFPASRRSGSPL